MTLLTREPIYDSQLQALGIVVESCMACQAGGLMLRSPKQQFIATAYFFVKYVMSFPQPKKRNPLLEKTDAYGAWIRRTVKHVSLELLARELKALEISPMS